LGKPLSRIAGDGAPAEPEASTAENAEPEGSQRLTGEGQPRSDEEEFTMKSMKDMKRGWRLPRPVDTARWGLDGEPCSKSLFHFLSDLGELSELAEFAEFGAFRGKTLGITV